MKRTESLDQTEHISDIFTRIMLKLMAPNLSDGEQQGISLSQFNALRHIASHSPCTIGGIAEALSVSQPAATMLVERMVRKGLVERRSGSTDRRQADVVIAESGRTILQGIEAERTKRLAGIVNQMAPADRANLVESLGRFVEAALDTRELSGEACLHCGVEHNDECIVNKSRGMVNG